MAAMAEGSVDAIVCDPPYELAFMGRAWDQQGVAYDPATWAQALRVLKPGAHLLAFGGTRTFHRVTVAIEDAGFEIRDCLSWLYGSGFPKSLDVSKAIDKRPGVTRHAEFAAHLRERMAAKGYSNTFDVAEAVIGRRTGAVANWQKYQWPEAKWWPALRDLLDLDESWGDVIAEADREKTGEREVGKLAVAPGQSADRSATSIDLTSAATPDAEQWQGWGTALKPAWEPIVVARKPLAATVAANVLAHGTGALNVDGCRIAGSVPQTTHGVFSRQGELYGKFRDEPEPSMVNASGRWPANTVLSHDECCVPIGERRVRGSSGVRVLWACIPGCPVRMLDEQSGNLRARGNVSPTRREQSGGVTGWGIGPDGPADVGDAGGASRFFYCAKASRAERNAGIPANRNVHPTVKPIDLMRWLVRLVTPPGGTVLDPFAGSGTTGCAVLLEGFDFIGCEREAEYVEIAKARIAWWAAHPAGVAPAVAYAAARRQEEIASTGQGDLFGGGLGD
jgi:DNA modification methylase